MIDFDKSQTALAFLDSLGMSSSCVNPSECLPEMVDTIKKGLLMPCVGMPMIPTYLYNDGDIPLYEPVAVIDAGGTNFRSALVCFDGDGIQLSHYHQRKMPGTDRAVDWQEFIAFIAESISPLMECTDKIGFCFSYSATITPELDGIVHRIDKEVVINNSEGQKIAQSLQNELKARGFAGKRLVILNDTIAVLLGGTSSLNKADYCGFIGQVSGTGTNTCCALPNNAIAKLSGLEPSKAMLLNMESGMYDRLPRGELDELLDARSNNPGEKLLEKMSSGAYLGELAKSILIKAGEVSLVSSETAENIQSVDKLDTSLLDAWTRNKNPSELIVNSEDFDFARTVGFELIARSAACMCTILIGLASVMAENGADMLKPVCVCAEGSLVRKSLYYKPLLISLLEEHGTRALGYRFALHVGDDTTLSGSAAAALLNI